MSDNKNKTSDSESGLSPEKQPFTKSQLQNLKRIDPSRAFSPYEKQSSAHGHRGRTS